jgi:hypothetical protein
LAEQQSALHNEFYEPWPVGPTASPNVPAAATQFKSDACKPDRLRQDDQCEAMNVHPQVAGEDADDHERPDDGAVRGNSST